MFRCSSCGVETQHDHEGNGCHACGRGTMRKVRISMAREQGAIDALRAVAKLITKITDNHVGAKNPFAAAIVNTKRENADFLNTIANCLEAGKTVDSLINQVDTFIPKGPEQNERGRYHH